MREMFILGIMKNTDISCVTACQSNKPLPQVHCDIMTIQSRLHAARCLAWFYCRRQSCTSLHVVKDDLFVSRGQWSCDVWRVADLVPLPPTTALAVLENYDSGLRAWALLRHSSKIHQHEDSVGFHKTHRYITYTACIHYRGSCDGDVNKTDAI